VANADYPLSIGPKARRTFPRAWRWPRHLRRQARCTEAGASADNLAASTAINRAPALRIGAF